MLAVCGQAEQSVHVAAGGANESIQVVPGGVADGSLECLGNVGHVEGINSEVIVILSGLDGAPHRHFGPVICGLSPVSDGNTAE